MAGMRKTMISNECSKTPAIAGETGGTAGHSGPETVQFIPLFPLFAPTVGYHRVFPFAGIVYAGRSGVGASDSYLTFVLSICFPKEER
jgi:hypothetical protein